MQTVSKLLTRRTLGGLGRFSLILITLWVGLPAMAAASPERAEIPDGLERSGPSSGGTLTDSALVRVYLQDYLKELGELSDFGYDIAGVDVGLSADVIVNDGQLNELKAKGIDYEMIADAEGLGAPDVRYFDPGRLDQELTRREAAYPNLMKRSPIGVTAEGRTIWAATVTSNVTQDQDKPTVLFDATHHAREVMSTEIAMDLIDQLLKNYDNPDQPWVKEWVDKLEIWVVPMVNPDGNAYVWDRCRWQRKNRRSCGPDRSCGALLGTDPNRNYDFNWGPAGCNGSTSNCYDDTYRGGAPWEEESAALRDLALRIRPVFDISFHSFGELVLLPFSCTTLASEDTTLRDIARAIGRLIPRDRGGMGYTIGRSPEVLYRMDGDSIDWMYAQVGTFAYVIEVNSGSLGFQPGYDPWRDFTVEALRPIDSDGTRGGWQAVLDRVYSGPSIFGHTYNARTRQPLDEVTIEINEISFTQGESPRRSNRFGRYHWILMPGAYTITFSKSGFMPKTLEITVDDAPVETDIFLDPV